MSKENRNQVCPDIAERINQALGGKYTLVAMEVKGDKYSNVVTIKLTYKLPLFEPKRLCSSKFNRLKYIEVDSEEEKVIFIPGGWEDDKCKKHSAYVQIVPNGGEIIYSVPRCDGTEKEAH